MNVDGFRDNLGTNISCQERTGGLNQQFQSEIPPDKEGKKYFKKPFFHGDYNDQNSIVDGLKSIGENSSPEYRAIIANINGIQNYDKKNNKNENTAMINLLKIGKLKKP